MMRFLVSLLFALVRAQTTEYRNTDTQRRCCAALAAVNFTSELPVIIIDTSGRQIPGLPPNIDAPKIEVTLCTCSPATDTAPLDYLGNVGIHIRGSTTRKEYVKKSYAIDLRKGLVPNTTGSGSDSISFPFVGLPTATNWILYGPEKDFEMGLRNWLAYDSWRAMDPSVWGPRSRFVEVFLNDNGGPLQAADYHGIYLVLERIERDPNRLNLTRLNMTTDPSGGYIWSYENDNIKASDVTFNSSFSGLEFPFVYPSKPDQAAINWLKTYFEHFEEATLSPQFMNPTTGYRAFVNESHAINYFLIVEFSKNPDAYRGSTYMYKDAEATIGFEPWDYNEAFGLCCGYPIEGYQNGGQSTGLSGGSAISPNGWRFNICNEPSRCLVDPTDGISRYFRRFWEDPEFRVAVGAKYRALRSGPWSDQTLVGRIQAKVDLIRPAVVRNYAEYQSVLLPGSGFTSGEQMWDYYVSTFVKWLVARLAWMDTALTPAAVAAPVPVTAPVVSPVMPAATAPAVSASSGAGNP